MSSGLRSFETYRYTDAFSGYPCIASVSQDELIVGDWSGNLFCVTVSPFAVSNQAFVANKICGDLVVNNTLRSVRTGTENAMLHAVATRGNHAAVWDRGTNSVIRVVPNNGPVSAVAWIQDDEVLLLGTGYYSLTPGVTPQARIEAWKPDREESSFICRMALPGVSVDAITVSENDEGSLDVIAFSGMKSQDRGFISILDNMLVPKAFFELPSTTVTHLECTERLIFVSHSGKVQAFSRSDGNEVWCHEIAGALDDFAFDPDSYELFLPNGELISAEDGEVLETWPALPNCCCVRPRPEGGVFGVSTTGTIGVWNVTS